MTTEMMKSLTQNTIDNGHSLKLPSRCQTNKPRGFNQIWGDHKYPLYNQVKVAYLGWMGSAQLEQVKSPKNNQMMLQ